MDPDAFGMIYHVYQPNSNGEYFDMHFSDNRGKELFKSFPKVVFYFHGMLEVPLTETYIQVLRQYFNDQGSPFIIVDYSGGNQGDLFQSVPNARSVGAAVGYSIFIWDIAPRTLIIGFSLGGQAISFAGKYVQELSGQKLKIKECIGLDPGGPLWQGAPTITKLTKTDCDLVQVIHTSAQIIPEFSVPFSFILGSLGTGDKSGHCDYWINCGFFQPEPCLGPDATVCSHFRANLFYINILYGRCNFSAHECSNCGKRFQTCSIQDPKNSVSIASGLKCNRGQDINYVVYTEMGNSCPSYNMASMLNPLPPKLM